MRSQSVLTRRLFRALIANQPYHAAACPLRAVAARHTAITPTTRPTQRRSLFGLSIGSAIAKDLTGQRATPQNVETALVKLSEYISAKRSHSRPPSDQALVDALRFLTSTKVEQEKTMTRNEVYLATETFQYLVGQGVVVNEDVPKGLTEEDLRTILEALVLPIGREEHRSDSVALADMVLERVLQAFADKSTTYNPHSELFGRAHLVVLASSGAAKRALASYNEWDGVGRLTGPEDAGAHAVLSGLFAEGLFDDFWAFFNRFSDQGPSVPHFLIRLLCLRNEPERARRLWKEEGYEKYMSADSKPAVVMVRSLVNAGHGDPADDWPSVFAKYTADDGVAGVLLLWHAALGVEVNHLLVEAKSYSEQGADISMTDINMLLAYAYSKGDPGLAEQYVHLAQSIGLVPDAQTFAHKLDYELSIGDLSAAQSTFEGLSIQDVPIERDDILTLNKYITKLATAPNTDVQLTMRVVDRIVETDGSLDADALAALSSVFLQRGELDEVMNMLRYRIEYLPSQERARVAQVFKDLIVDLDIKDQRAFDAYELFRSAFPETPPSERLIIMHSFFDRKRSDLACLVFGHMRQRQEVENRPSEEAYAQCFYGIARCRDVDGLQMIYNMLKMDTFVEQTTRVHNAMMAAYAACQTPFTAIIDHYWKILDSREGPTLSTFMLALRACETWIGAGGEEARRIMALMQKWNLVITKDVYHCYIGALAGQSQFENTIELIENMEADIGEAPDATTIGTFYNAIPWQYRKDEVESWAKRFYPELWEELVSYGDEIDEEWEVRYFNVNRDIEVDDELLFSQGEYTPVLAEQARLGLPAPREA